MKPSLRKAMLFIFLSGFAFGVPGQSTPEKGKEEKYKPASKPFKLLTNGRQVTIQSREELKSLLVWTASGNRIVEQKELKTTSHSFTVPVKENIIFLLIELTNGRRYTEKLGVR
jgi:hypothetical protein